VSVQAEAPPIVVRDDRAPATPFTVNAASGDAGAGHAAPHRRSVADDFREIAWDYWHGRDLL
jgi:hypothetical protein